MVSSHLGEEWDAALRRLAAVPVPGNPTLSYRREPSYFAGIRGQGQRVAVLGTTEGGELTSAVTRAVKRVFIDGEERELGYWGGLRVAPRYQGRLFLGRGYAYLRACQDADPVPGYLCTFIKGNDAALRALTKARSILPANIAWGEYRTYSIFLRGGSVPATVSRLPSGLERRVGSAVDIDEACAFLRAVLGRRQFAPVYYPEDFTVGYLSAFDPAGWIGLYRDGRLAALAARWSQHAFKQTVVAEYAGFLNRARPLLNVGLRAAGIRELPPAGDELRASYLAFLAVRDDDPALAAVLVDAAAAMAAAAGDHFLLAGFHARDALAAAVRRRLHVRYDSHVFIAAWPDTEATVRVWDRNAIPYLELATL